MTRPDNREERDREDPHGEHPSGPVPPEAMHHGDREKRRGESEHEHLCARDEDGIMENGVDSGGQNTPVQWLKDPGEIEPALWVIAVGVISAPGRSSGPRPGRETQIGKNKPACHPPRASRHAVRPPT